MTPEKEIQGILDDISKLKGKKIDFYKESKKYSDRLLAIVKREFQNCTVTVSGCNLYSGYDESYVHLETCVKITLSKVARMEVSWSGDPGSGLSIFQTWRVEIYDYHSERSEYVRKWPPQTIEQHKDFQFAEIKKYLKDKSKYKVTNEGNIVPGIIRYLKKNLDPTLSFHKVGTGNDSQWFLYSTKIFNLEFFLKQDVVNINLRSISAGGSLEIDIPLADPKCFDKLKQEIIINATVYYIEMIQNIERSIKKKQEELIETRALVDKISSMKEKT